MCWSFSRDTGSDKVCVDSQSANRGKGERVTNFSRLSNSRRNSLTTVLIRELPNEMPARPV